MQNQGLCTDKLCRYEEVDNLFFYHYLKWTNRRFCHQSAVYANERAWLYVYCGFLCAIGVHASVVQELATQEEINAFEQLGYFGVVHHRHI